jgi:hypothetical protein
VAEISQSGSGGRNPQRTRRRSRAHELLAWPLGFHSCAGSSGWVAAALSHARATTSADHEATVTVDADGAACVAGTGPWLPT